MQLKASDNLAPVREQVKQLVEKDSRVIEFGCGKGELLFTLSSKIRSGKGIDRSKQEIDQAIAQQQLIHAHHLGFLNIVLDRSYTSAEKFDVSLASLFFHVIPNDEAVFLLHKMKEISSSMIICAFSKPERMDQKLLLYLDQRISGHYRHFKDYQKQGYMEGLFAKAKIGTVISHDTHIPFLNIYQIPAVKV